MDRVTVYRTPDLRKIREQGLQRPLERIWANFDGTILFATASPHSELFVLDADTLWQLRAIKSSSWGGVERVAVVR